MINVVLCFGVLLILIINVMCSIPLRCRESKCNLKSTCTINGYTTKLETADTFILVYIYQTTNITNLKFTNSKVTYIPNEIFTNLKNLHSLDLSGSYVVNMSKITFLSSWNLRELILSHNLITELNDLVFDSAYNLELIDLSYNKIRTIQSSAFSQLLYLKKLDLSHNNIKIESSNILPAHILFLNLDFNEITNFSIIESSNIEQITLNNNKLTFLKINSLIKSLQANNNTLESKHLVFKNGNLNSLSLKHNLLANFNFINNMTTLSYLDLSNNPKNGDSNMFNTLTNLKTLILKSSKLSQSDIELFSELYNLETLDISSNNLSYIDFHLISRLENLKYLNLHNNNLSTLTFNEFDYLFPNLTAIDISENNWICADLIMVLFKLKELQINITVDTANYNAGSNIHGIQCTKTTAIMLKHKPDLDNIQINTEVNQILNDLQNDNILLKTNLNEILHKLNNTVVYDDVIIDNMPCIQCTNTIRYGAKHETDLDNIRNNTELNQILNDLQNDNDLLKTNLNEILHRKLNDTVLYDNVIIVNVPQNVLVAIPVLAIILVVGLLIIIYKKYRGGHNRDRYNNYNFPTIQCSKAEQGLYNKSVST